MPIATVFFDFGDTLVFTNAAGERERFIDTLDVLQVLQERGWRIGLLSNQTAGTTVAQVQARLAALGIGRYVETDLITISTELSGNIGKPARPIYDLALTKAGLGATPAEAMFVTEEMAHVSAARGFGWRAALIKRVGACGAADGECATSLSELLSLLPARASRAALAGTNFAIAPPPGSSMGCGRCRWTSRASMPRSSLTPPPRARRVRRLCSFAWAATLAVPSLIFARRRAPWSSMARSCRSPTSRPTTSEEGQAPN